jgi:hypothetical protein
MDELEDVFGLKQVLESVVAQVAEPGLSGQSLFRQIRGEGG